MLNSLLEISRSPPKLNIRECFEIDPFDFIEFLKRIILDPNDCHKIVKIIFWLHKLSLHRVIFKSTIWSALLIFTTWKCLQLLLTFISWMDELIFLIFFFLFLQMLALPLLATYPALARLNGSLLWFLLALVSVSKSALGVSITVVTLHTCNVSFTRYQFDHAK